MGIVWSATTLLARQMRHLRALEEIDVAQRLWTAPWQVVAEAVPAYGERVHARKAQLGPTHPFIRTEYELRELDAPQPAPPPSAPAVPAGGDRPAPVDPERLPASEKIRRGLASRHP